MHTGGFVVDRDFRTEFTFAREADVEHGLIVLPAMALGDFVVQRVVFVEIVSDVFARDRHQRAESEISMSRHGFSCCVEESKCWCVTSAS